MSRLLIFAGTTEGRLLAQRLDALGEDALVCVATEYGKEILPPFSHVRIRQGRMETAEMAKLIRQEKIRAAVDATHPYAAQASRQIRQACEQTGIPLLRCLRKETLDLKQLPQGTEESVIRFPSLKKAVSWLEGQEGNILAVTGTKELAAYTALSCFSQRVFARVLPSAEAMDICRSLGLSGRHIVGMQGPFSVSMNLAFIKEFDCRFLVTKDGGPEGGTAEKLTAAHQAGILAVVIERPLREEGMTVDEVINWYGQQDWL